MSTQYQTIEYAVADGIAEVRLNRPDRMNAFTPRMAAELVHAADRWDADDDVRCVIVAGNGRAFCAGADLGGGDATFDAAATADYVREHSSGGGLPTMDDMHGDHPDAVRDIGGWVGLRFFASTKPMIAAVNGAAVGIGATMTLPMDIRLATDRAKFGFVFAARGIVPEACSSWFLPRLVGISTAAEWCYTSRLVLADEALAGGLVRSVHADDDLLVEARRIAAEIAANSAPVSVALTRHMLWSMMGAAHPMDAHVLESRGVTFTGRSTDAREGIKSFFQKRPAEWSGSVSQDMPDWYPWVNQPPFS